MLAVATSAPRPGGAEELLVRTVPECVIRARLPLKSCTAAFETAWAEYRARAPRFTDRTSCTKAFNTCIVYAPPPPGGGRTPRLTPRNLRFAPPLAGVSVTRDTVQAFMDIPRVKLGEPRRLFRPEELVPVPQGQFGPGLVSRPAGFFALPRAPKPVTPAFDAGPSETRVFRNPVDPEALPGEALTIPVPARLRPHRLPE